MPSETLDSLYDRDALAWSEHQADLLRRHAAGERLNETIDWANVIEEIETVGRSELFRCESQLLNAMVHLLKLHAWPDSQADDHWRVEILAFLRNARRAFSPSMRQRINMQDLFSDALSDVLAMRMGGVVPAPLPETCPFALADLLARPPDIALLTARLATPPAPPPS